MKKSIIYCAIALFATASCGKETGSGTALVGGACQRLVCGAGWPVGFSYVAATAINQFESGRRELRSEDHRLQMSKAEELGFNTVHIFLHDMVWEADPASSSSASTHSSESAATTGSRPS